MVMNMRVRFSIPKEAFKGKRKAKYIINGEEITAKAGAFIENEDGTFSWVFDFICYDDTSKSYEERKDCPEIPEVLDARLKTIDTVYWRYSRRYQDYVEKHATAFKSNLKLKRLFLKTVKFLKENRDRVKIIIEPSNWESEFLKSFEVALFVGGLGLEGFNIEAPVNFEEFLPYVQNFRKSIDSFSKIGPFLFEIEEVLERDTYKTTELYTVKLKKYHEYATNKYEGVIKKTIIGWDSEVKEIISSPHAIETPTAKLVYSILHKKDIGPYPELYGREKPFFKVVTPKAVYSYGLDTKQVHIGDTTVYKAIYTKKLWEEFTEVDNVELTIDKGFKLIPRVSGYDLVKDGVILGWTTSFYIYPRDKVEKEFLNLLKEGIIELDKSNVLISEDVRYGLDIVPMKLNGKPIKGGISIYSRIFQIPGELRVGDIITIESRGREWRFLVVAIEEDKGKAYNMDGYSPFPKYPDEYRPFWSIYGDYSVKAE
jgi:hypothetical protein